VIYGLSAQGLLFLWAVLTGGSIGFLYDAFRILRKTMPLFAKYAVAAQDTVFWLAATGVMFWFLLHENFGEIRLFAVLGAALGVVLYFAALSRPLTKILVTVIEFLKKVIITALKIIFAPLIWLYKRLAPKFRSGLSRMARYGKIKGKTAGRNWFIFRKKV